MLRLRRPSGLCSRMLSDTAYRFQHGSTLCSPTVEKILCRSPFSQRSHVGNLRQTLQGKGVIHKRVETAGVYPLVRPRGVSAGCLPSCAPARRQRRLSTLLCACRAGKISSLRKRHSAVLHQNAKEEHCCLAVSLFAHITGFCFPDFSAVPHGGALLRSPEALSPALQRTRVSPGRCAYARDSRSYPRTDRAFSADD